MKKFLRVVCIAMGVLISFGVSAGVQRPVCNGSPGTVDASLTGDVIWQGSWTFLNNSGWREASNYRRSISDGPVGQMADTGASGDFSVCWSLSPFTVANTNNGETCVHEGPLEYTYSTTYYRMNIDRSVSPTEYCQVAMVTGPENATRGDTYVVPLAAGQTAAVPAFQIWALWLLVGIISVFGATKLRKAS